MTSGFCIGQHRSRPLMILNLDFYNCLYYSFHKSIICSLESFCAVARLIEQTFHWYVTLLYQVSVASRLKVAFKTFCKMVHSILLPHMSLELPATNLVLSQAVSSALVSLLHFSKYHRHHKKPGPIKTPWTLHAFHFLNSYGAHILSIQPPNTLQLFIIYHYLLLSNCYMCISLSFPSEF